METISHTNDWNIEQIIDALDQHSFAIIDHAYPSDYLNNLVNEGTLNLNKFRDAAIQNGVIIGICNEIDGYIKSYSSIYQDITTFLTGGDCLFFEKRVKIKSTNI